MDLITYWNSKYISSDISVLYLEFNKSQTYCKSPQMKSDLKSSYDKEKMLGAFLLWCIIFLYFMLER